jgi:FMN phosphatase YigB (HAD superfamily)
MKYIAFDIDGTLVHTGWKTANDELNHTTAHLLILLSALPDVKIIVWSGGGEAYAKQQVRRFGLEEFVWRCASKLDSSLPKVDLAFDDEAAFALAKVNLQVVFAAPKDTP